MLGSSLGVLHKVKPSYLWLTEWLAARLGWAVKNKEYTHGEDNSEVRYLTRVGRVFPHAIERSDGALVGAMKVEPANMALEDDDAWAKSRDSPPSSSTRPSISGEVYITSREVDQDDVVRDHQRRLGDADVRSRPVPQAPARRVHYDQHGSERRHRLEGYDHPRILHHHRRS